MPFSRLASRSRPVSRTARIIIATIVALLGCIGLVCGLYSGVLFPMIFNLETERVRSLEPSSFVVIEDGVPGREVLIEGELSARNPISPEGFIAYTRSERVVADNGNRTWREVASVYPPLLVDLRGGIVQVRDGYRLSGVLESVQRGGARFAGLRPGDVVLVVGTMVEGRQGIEVQPDLVFAGSREEYFAENATTVLIFRSLGWIVGGCGAAMAAVGLALAVRFARARGA
jgi:hypothetical protein